MSVTDVQSRISEIRAQLALLSPTGSASASAVSGTVPGTVTGAAAARSAAAFATSLSAQATAATPQAAAGSTGSAGGASGADVVAEARKYLGVPYVWGGTDPDRGLDCSGLVQLVYKNLGYELPRVSYQQATAGTAVTGGLANARPGDILAFGSPVHHVAIYIGDGKMLEAPRPGLDVRIADVYETPSHIRRIIPDGGVSAAGASRVAPGTPYAGLFQSAAANHGVDAGLLVAVARQESGFDAGAVSPAGAQGLMQLMPATARGLGVTDSFDPAQAVDGAARLLKSLLQEFGRTDLALAAYNAGPGAVHRYGGVPPYTETQNYVRSIMAMLERS